MHDIHTIVQTFIKVISTKADCSSSNDQLCVSGDNKLSVYRALFCPNDIHLMRNASHPNLEKMMHLVQLETQTQIINDTYMIQHQQTQHIPTDDQSTKQWFQNVEDILHTKVVVAIAIFGLIGNILNLLVLTQKGLQYSMGRMEKFAHTGLISLAVSDMLFCLLTIPYSFVPLHTINFERITFFTIYNLYSGAVINIFVMSSTMLTVMMATGRYFAIVHPIRARQFIGMTCAGRSIFMVFIACIAFNIPRFWRYNLYHVECLDGSTFYVREDGVYKEFELPYLCCYFIIGILFPLLVLAFSNAFLIRALHQAKNRIVRFRKNETQQETSQRVTLTLVVIVIFYLVLVTPAEITNLWRQIVAGDGKSSPTSNQFNLAVAAVNVLEAINFAFNFVLYCVINTHFRRIVHSLLRCRWEALLPVKHAHYDSSMGDSGSASMRSTAQTSMRTYVYNGLSVRSAIAAGSPTIKEETDVNSKFNPGTEM